MISRCLPFFISLSIHVAAVFAMWIALKSSPINVETKSSVGNMNWEVEAAPAAHLHAATTHATSITSGRAGGTTSVAPSGSASTAPDSSQVQSYLSLIRSHLADAIHIHEPRGAEVSTLVLKIRIQRFGKLETQEIEKTSGNPLVDQGVLQALDSILPLPPFPAEWEKAGIRPERITVRVPVEIRQNP
jgi:TonB family protein